MGGALVVCDSIWTPSRSLLLEPKREASKLKLQSQVPSPPTCTLPSLLYPPSHLLMLKDLSSSFCATAPARPSGPPQREPGVPVPQDLTVPASPSSCKPASPLGLGPYCSPTWRTLPLPSSLLAELLHIPQCPACKSPPVCGLPDKLLSPFPPTASCFVVVCSCPASPLDPEPRGKLWGSRSEHELEAVQPPLGSALPSQAV